MKALILVASILVFIPSADSQPEPRPQETKASEHAQHTNASERSTDKELSTNFDSQKEQDEAATRRYESYYSAIRERQLVTLTHDLVVATLILAFIVFVQAGLFVWQLVLIQSSSKDTQELASAAKVSADATKMTAETARKEFIANQRPRLKIHDMEVTRNNNTIGAHIWCVNWGGTMATIVHVEVGLFDTEHPMHGNYKQVKSIPFEKLSLDPGQFGELEVGSHYSAHNADEFDQRGHRHPSLKLTCLGRIRYTDANGLEQSTGFCRVYERGEWVRTNDEREYEY